MIWTQSCSRCLYPKCAGKGHLEEGLEGKKLDLPAAEEDGLKRQTNPEG